MRARRGRRHDNGLGVSVLRSAVRFGVSALEAIPRTVDVEARGVENVLRLMLFVPTVPRRFAVVMRDMLVVLAAMPGRGDPAPWHTFGTRFVRVHRQTAPTRWANLQTGIRGQNSKSR
jgi:hypothetical protein